MCYQQLYFITNSLLRMTRTSFPEDLCFSGLDIGGIGRLHHSHFYYSQIVPRFGGRWVASNDKEVQLVVAPSDVVSICSTNKMLRQQVIGILRRKDRVKLVSELFMTESLEKRRMLMPSEVDEMKIHIPDQIKQSWRVEKTATLRTALSDKLQHAEQVSSEMRYLSEGEELKKESKNTATQTGMNKIIKKQVSDDEDDYEIQPEVRKDSTKEDLEYYATQQAGKNQQLMDSINRSLDMYGKRVQSLISDVITSSTVIRSSLTDSSNSMAAFFINVRSSKLVGQSKSKFLPENIKIKHFVDPTSHSLIFHSLNPFKKLITRLKNPIKEHDSNDIFTSLIPMWDSYTMTTTDVDFEASSVPKSMRMTNRLAFSDFLEDFKSEVLYPFYKEIAEKQKRIDRCEQARSSALSIKDYAASLQHLKEIISRYEEVLDGITKGETAFSTGLFGAGNATTMKDAFKIGKNELQNVIQQKEKSINNIDDDEVALRVAESSLRQLIRQQEDTKKLKIEETTKLLNKNTREQQQILDEIRVLSESITETVKKRRDISEQAAEEIERISDKIKEANHHITLITTYDKKRKELSSHLKKCIDMTHLVEDYYCDMEVIIDSKQSVESELREYTVEISKLHLKTITDYCEKVSDLIKALASKKVGLQVHRRAIELQLELAENSLSCGYEENESLQKSLSNQEIAITNDINAACNRLQNRIKLFDRRPATILQEEDMKFTPPSSIALELISRGDAVSRDLLSTHLESEKVAVAEEIRRGISSPPASPAKGKMKSQTTQKIKAN